MNQNMKTVRNRVSVVVVHNKRILGFHAEDPTSKEKYFFLPGGRVEINEDPVAAAIRETLEETGYEIQVDAGTKIFRQYDFFWDGALYDTRTSFYLGHLVNETAREVNDAHYHQGVDWVSIDELEATFNYHQDILEPIQILAAKAQKVER